MATRKKKAEPTLTSELLNAVRFVGLTLKEKGTVQDQFCMVGGGWITAFNGVIALGAPIVQQLMAAPHAKRFEDALSGCTMDLQVTQQSDDKLHVRSGDFQAFVPCCPTESIRTLVWPKPDAPRGAVEDSLKAAIIRAGAVASAKAPSALCQAVTLNSETVVATNNTCIIEMWHGYAVRDNIKLPKVAVAMLSKIKKPLMSIGWSDTSCTFHFNDRSWMKTNLIAENIPDLRKYLLEQSKVPNAHPAPAEFFTVVGKLAKFAYDGRVYCANNAITAWENAGKELSAEGSYEVPGAPSNLSFNAADLLEIADLVQTIDFRAMPEAAMFFGVKCRGAVRWQDMIPKITTPLPSVQWKPDNYSTKCWNCSKDCPNTEPLCPHCGVSISDDDIPF